MYQTIAILQKSSGFLEWKPFSTIDEWYMVQLHLLGTLDLFTE